MIDGRLPDPWPGEAMEAARVFRQGSLLESPPFFYWRSEHHPIWQLELEPVATGEALALLADDERPTYGLITTHTCDLYEEGRPKQPWFAAAPVYELPDLTDSGRMAQLRRGEIGHLILLTADFLAGGIWVADLRIEVPLEKGLLVGRAPLPAFADESEYLRLGRRLASRRGRPALSPELTDHIVRRVRDWLRADGRAGGRRYRDEIWSLRLGTMGNPAVSTVGRLFVVSADQPVSTEASAALTSLQAKITDEAAEVGVVVLPFEYRTLDTLSAREMEQSLLLDFDYLSPDD